MNLVLTVLQVVAPVFILAAGGFTWVKLGHEFRVQFVTRLAMTVAVPCLIFTALMKTEVDPKALATISLAALAAYGALIVLFWAGTSLAGLDRRTWLAPLIFGNTGNLGLPLALFAFGQTGLGYAVVIFAVMAVLSFTFGVWVVAGGGKPWLVLKEPIVAATLLGGLFLWQGWQTPVWLTHTLELTGQMAIPLMLITLGVAVARLSPGRLGRSGLLALVKLGVCIAAGVGAGLLFRLDRVAFAVLVLQVSTPVAVTSYMLAEKYGADAEAVAGLVVVSTVLSVAAIPLTLGFLM
ncbi:AEC family transporter [Acidimangrovimonas pyrenivorans]|uniref:AEC family transporter n=1 Tax=Acidimangrovimonas pyrenivorans TaxID=2030798 RepID=A0ABV7ABC8_9RHOB